MKLNELIQNLEEEIGGIDSVLKTKIYTSPNFCRVFIQKDIGGYEGLIHYSEDIETDDVNDVCKQLPKCEGVVKVSDEAFVDGVEGSFALSDFLGHI